MSDNILFMQPLYSLIVHSKITLVTVLLESIDQTSNNIRTKLKNVSGPPAWSFSQVITHFLAIQIRT